MSGFSLRRRWRAVVSAVAVAFAFASCPTKVSAQASIRFSPLGTYYFAPSGDGSALLGIEGESYVPFIEKNGVKTLLTMGGSYGNLGGWTPDGSTVVGTEEVQNFARRAWIWHEGDPAPSPFLPGLDIYSISMGFDGETIFGLLPVPGTYDAQGFVIRDGAFTLLTYPGAVSTAPSWVSNDGSVIAGTVYVYNPATFNLVVKAVIWHADGSSTDVPLPESRESSATGISADGSTVFGRYYPGFSSQSHAFIWRLGDPGVTTVHLGGENTSINSVTADGSTAVGGGYVDFQTLRGFVWRNGSVEILEPKAGFASSYAAMITLDGSRIVGESWGPPPSDTNNRKVTLWEAGRPPELLRDLLAAKGVTVGPLRLDAVYGMSFDGSVITGAANDGSNSLTQPTFVAVLPIPTPTEMIQELIDEVQASNISPFVKIPLLIKLYVALIAAQFDADAVAIIALQSFVDQVERESGRRIPVELASEWIADAEEIIDLLSD